MRRGHIRILMRIELSEWSSYWLLPPKLYLLVSIGKEFPVIRTEIGVFSKKICKFSCPTVDLTDYREIKLFKRCLITKDKLIGLASFNGQSNSVLKSDQGKPLANILFLE
jgi:hypothetical protein